MPPCPSFIAGDWGTSSLRLWACAADGTVLAARQSAEGMSRLSPDAFEPVLRSHLQAFDLTSFPRPVPVVLCGMVGARQGWREAGYVTIPADPARVCAAALPVDAEGLDIRILPGLAEHMPGREDVMRGEETQLLGLLLQEPGLSGSVCLPGTHSKWVRLEHGRIIGFTTAMTGELFALLRQHSVLRHSLGPSLGEPSGSGQSGAFARGVRRSLAEPERLITSLFGVRAAGLLGGLPEADASDYLSGLLIGAEVAACAEGAAPVTLVAGAGLAASYARALELAGRPVRRVDAADVTLAGLRLAATQIWPGAFA